MAEKPKYRSFFGAVQFDVREGKAAGKDVRNVTIRNIGVKDQNMNVSCTLWPSHDHIAVEKGDVLFVEGKFEPKVVGDGEDRKIYFNLSVTGIRNFGPLDYGTRPGTTSDDELSVDDDDIPY